MSKHEPFFFSSVDELLDKAEELRVSLPYKETTNELFEKMTVGLRNVPNRFCVQPMEGFDADPDGAPSSLTFRRYTRYAEGGYGLIWFEAAGVVPEGRSNPYQLFLGARNLDSFEKLVMETRKAAYRTYGDGQELFCVLQLTHSGRYSRPDGRLRPVGVISNPFLEGPDDSVQILNDDDLERLMEDYIEAARLAEKAGFDAVDIKACHGYLVNEMLGAFARKKGRFGATFENRSRFLVELLQRLHDVVPGLAAAVRLSAYDGIPYPYGFGVAKDGSLDPNILEPKRLVHNLIDAGCILFNVTAGNPAFNPHIGRPFDRPANNTPLPDEHPLVGVYRLITLCGELQKEFPYVPFVGTGYSWLRHFFPYIAAGVLARGKTSFIGLGRSSFAYPDAPRELQQNKKLNPEKVCICCSRCTELMRSGRVTGCVIRDGSIYAKEYKKIGGWNK
ncbi:MAG: hypothetical protein JXB26_13505 [Candidatus Aminicenantes bacterium]|nr:hypothetical protein [Candidatus Aminicenantes bacterium]